MTMPTADEVGTLAKSLAAVAGVVGGVWALVAKVRRRRQRDRERREAESRAIRYLLDATRHALNVLAPADERRFIDVDELVRQKLLIDQIRDALWQFDGHESERATEQAAENIVRVLTRTQRIQVKQQKQDIFPEGER